MSCMTGVAASKGTVPQHALGLSMLSKGPDAGSNAHLYLPQSLTNTPTLTGCST